MNLDLHLPWLLPSALIISVAVCICTSIPKKVTTELNYYCDPALSPLTKHSTELLLCVNLYQSLTMNCYTYRLTIFDQCTHPAPCCACCIKCPMNCYTYAFDLSSSQCTHKLLLQRDWHWAAVPSETGSLHYTADTLRTVHAHETVAVCAAFPVFAM